MNAIWPKSLIIQLCVCVTLFLVPKSALAAGIENLSCDPFFAAGSENARAYSRNIENLDVSHPVRSLVAWAEVPSFTSIPPNFAQLKKVTRQISNFYEVMSEGELEFEWTFLEQSVKVPSVLDSFATSLSSEEIAQFGEAAQNEIFRQVDPKNFDYLMLLSPMASKNKFSRSISLLKREEKSINSTILGADFWSSNSSWAIAAHEIGHSLGLLDLYKVPSEVELALSYSDYLKQFAFMRNFDLMNSPSGSGPSLTMWNRLRIFPILSKRFLCVEHGNTKATLVDVNSKESGLKALIIRLSQTKALLVEARIAQGFDYDLSYRDTGIIMYLVDTSIESGKGPLRLNCDSVKSFGSIECGIKVGQSRKFENVEVHFHRRISNHYFVSVIFNN